MHKFVTLTVDVMFVNGEPFLVTLSQKIQLFTVELFPSLTAVQLISHLTKVLKLYERGGFSIRNIFMDQEFDKVMENIPEIEVIIASAQEYVGEIEREIRFIKDRCRGTRAIIPFKQLPNYFVVNMVYFFVMWINSFPATQGISEKLSPRKIIIKRSLIF